MSGPAKVWLTVKLKHLARWCAVLGEAAFVPANQA